jgi:hypothetical protein
VVVDFVIVSFYHVDEVAVPSPDLRVIHLDVETFAQSEETLDICIRNNPRVYTSWFSHRDLLKNGIGEYRRIRPDMMLIRELM